MKQRQIRRRRAHAAMYVNCHLTAAQCKRQDERGLRWIGVDLAIGPSQTAYVDAIRTGTGIVEMQVGRLDSGITFIEHDGTKVWVP